MYKKTWRGLVIALFLFVLLAGAPPAGAADGGTFAEILYYVQQLHVDSPREEVLYEGAIKGLIDSLNDPNTTYMKPDELETFSNVLQGTFDGVGIELVPGDTYPCIVRTLEGSPAENAGIKAGDILVKIEGSDIAGESLPDIVQKIRGPEGTRVRLSLQRTGIGEFDVELIRSSINLPTVHRELLDDGIGYIKIDIFGSRTADDFASSLTYLIKRGAKKLILDLRDNPGGYLQAAVQVAGNFLEEGREVVSIVNNDNHRDSYFAEGSMIAGGMPLVILINGSSASASEILAGALQDYGVATLIGERTFGKGTVQTVIPLQSGGALKVTTARYHTPNDRVIDHMGLEPDIQVLTSELQLEAAKKWLNPAGKTMVAFEDGRKEAFVNGSSVKLFQAPLRQADTIYLPLRFVLEALGYRVDWEFSDGGIRVTDSQLEVLFYPGEDGEILSGGQVVSETGSLLNKNGVFYISLSALKLFNLQAEVVNGRITIEK